MLVEHWDVIQDEATEAESKSGVPMFGSALAPLETEAIVSEAVGHAD